MKLPGQLRYDVEASGVGGAVERANERGLDRIAQLSGSRNLSSPCVIFRRVLRDFLATIRDA